MVTDDVPEYFTIDVPQASFSFKAWISELQNLFNTFNDAFKSENYPSSILDLNS